MVRQRNGRTPASSRSRLPAVASETADGRSMEPVVLGLVLPFLDLLLGVIAGHAIAFLDLSGPLLATALDGIEIVVGELAPLFLELAFHLLPVAFDNVPIHGSLLFNTHYTITRQGIWRASTAYGLTTMSFLTAFTFGTLRAIDSAVSRSVAFLAKPESWTVPFSVSTLIAMALTTGLSANRALTWVVFVDLSTNCPTVDCSRVTAHPPIVRELTASMAANNLLAFMMVSFLLVNGCGADRVDRLFGRPSVNQPSSCLASRVFKRGGARSSSRSNPARPASWRCPAPRERASPRPWSPSSRHISCPRRPATPTRSSMQRGDSGTTHSPSGCRPIRTDLWMRQRSTGACCPPSDPWPHRAQCWLSCPSQGRARRRPVPGLQRQPYCRRPAACNRPVRQDRSWRPNSRCGPSSGCWRCWRQAYSPRRWSTRPGNPPA